MPSAATLPIAAVVMSMVLIQVGAALGRLVLPQGDPVGLAFLRLAIGAALLLAVLRPRARTLMTGQWRDIGLLGASLALFNLAFYTALRDLPVGVVAAVGFLGPIGVGFAKAKRGRERLWAILALCGIGCFFPWGDAREADWAALGFGCLYALMWAIYIVVAARTGRTVKGLDGFALATAVAAVALTPVGAAASISYFATLPTAGLVLAIALIALTGFSLEYLALKRLDAGLFGLLLCLEPVIAALSGIAVAQDTLSPLGWIGVGCVSAAALGATLTHGRSQG